MKRSVRCGWLVAVLCLGIVVVGCASYYKVTDPQSGKEFYTQEVETLKGGAVKVKDARTGSIVTLQSSEVKEISSDEYKASLAAPVNKPAPTPAAAAPASAPAAAAPAPAEAAPASAPAAEPSSAPSGTK